MILDLLFAALTFLATFTVATIAVGLGYLLIQRSRAASNPGDSGELFEDRNELSLLRDDSLSTISFMDRLLARLDYVNTLRRMMAEADLNWSVGRVVGSMLLSGVIVLAGLQSISWVPTWAALLGTIGAISLPVILINSIRKRRLGKFELQFPDALDSLSNALRAGHPLAAGISIVATEYEDPLGSEMRQVFDERKLGLPMEHALDNLARRIPLMDVGLFVAAVQLQTRTGGNLGEALGRLSETMRESNALRGEVRSIAAHGKLTGLVLTALPFIVVVMMFFVNPTYFNPLLESPWGKHMIFAAIFMLLLAHFIIGRIVDIEI